MRNWGRLIAFCSAAAQAGCVFANEAEASAQNRTDETREIRIIGWHGGRPAELTDTRFTCANNDLDLRIQSKENALVSISVNGKPAPDSEMSELNTLMRGERFSVVAAVCGEESFYVDIMTWDIGTFRKQDSIIRNKGFTIDADGEVFTGTGYKEWRSASPSE